VNSQVLAEMITYYTYVHITRISHKHAHTHTHTHTSVGSVIVKTIYATILYIDRIGNVTENSIRYRYTCSYTLNDIYKYTELHS